MSAIRPILRRLAAPALLAGLTVTTGCVVNLGSWDNGSATTLNGVSVSERDGVLWADGVKLEHSRWVALSGQMDASASADLSTATGALELTGAAGGAWALEAFVHSELADDGVVSFEGGRLEVTSSKGHKAIINAIRGTLPSSLALEASSGTGDVTLTGFDGGREQRLTGGTGTLTLRQSKVGALIVDSGTGEVVLSDVQGARLELATGTGDVELRECRFESAELESGTADLEFHGGEFGRVEADTGTGDLDFHGTQVGQLEVESGTGDVVMHSGASAKASSLEFGTGRLIQR